MSRVKYFLFPQSFAYLVVPHVFKINVGQRKCGGKKKKMLHDALKSIDS